MNQRKKLSKNYSFEDYINSETLAIEMDIAMAHDWLNRNPNSKWRKDIERQYENKKIKLYEKLYGKERVNFD